MKILFTGGGTAGHVTPNLALIEKLYLTQQCYYLGTNGMEYELLQPYLDSGKVKQYYTITAHKLKRKLTADNLLLPFRLLSSIKQSKAILKELKPDVVFSKGGYVSLPVIISAHKLNIPTIVHESDMTMGLANKMSAKYATRLLSTFPCHPKAEQVGAILRPTLYTGDCKQGKEITHNYSNKPQLLVMGGSLGALQINKLIEHCADQLSQKYHIFAITGNNKKIDNANVVQEQYCNNIQDIFQCTDVCLTRGGSNSLAELTALGIPFAVLPLTQCSRGEQVANAEYFTKHGCGIILNNQTTPTQLMDAIDQLYNNKTVYKTAQKAITIDGTDKVADIILSYSNN